jgi:hypothetical protein
VEYCDGPHCHPYIEASCAIFRISTGVVDPETVAITKSDDDYVSELKLGALKSQADILSLATTLERGAASGYINSYRASGNPV